MLFMKNSFRPSPVFNINGQFLITNSPLAQKCLFSVSSLLHALPNHRLFDKVDWEKVDAGMYAVVDPVSPGRILYLTEQDYIIQIRVALTNNRTLKVLAAPGESPDSNSSQNSPPHPFIQELLVGAQKSLKRASSRIRYLFHSPFLADRARTDGEFDSMITVNSRNARTWAIKWHNLVSWWSRGYLMSTVAATERDRFGVRCLDLYKHNGVNFLIQYLKLALFATNSFLAGRKMENTQALGKRIELRNGLPAMIPLYARNGIRTGNRHYIHIWCSVLNGYKGLKGIWGQPSFKTIVQKHPDFSNNKFFNSLKEFVPYFWASLKTLGANLVPDLTLKNLFFTSRAGPNHPNAVLGAARDAHVWFYSAHESGFASRNLILEWLDMIGETRMRKVFRHAAKRYELTSSMLRSVAGNKNIANFNLIANLFGLDRTQSSQGDLTGSTFPAVLGRLHCLYEAAGKIRIVAIVDYWTNMCLKPLHDWMFKILSVLPTDATFDQEGRLREFTQRGYSDVWSLDLSSATDLIPLALYRALFEEILGTKTTSLWLDLLVGRDFLCPKEFGLPKGARIKYGTGQPMGALSSWSSMAMVHHLLVQFSAWRVTQAGLATMNLSLQQIRRIGWKPGTWFQDYLILGDDLVIADKQVAEAYIEVATALGVKIGLAKSFISDKGFLNFANQSYVGETNVSPLSFKEMIGVDSLARRAELACRAVRRGWTSMSSTGWLAPLLKLFVDARVWTQIQSDLNKGLNHPVVNWILSVLFVPGSARFADSVLPRASIKVYLATLLRKATIWSKPVQDLENLINEWVAWEEIVSILTRSVDMVYNDFLKARKDVEGFHKWMEATLSIDVEELLIILFYDQVKTSIDDWAKKYRTDLKSVQVCLRMPAVQPHILEMGSGLTLSQITLILSEAQSALPRVPDYSDLDYDTITKSENSADAYHGELTRFARISAMIGAAEHLHSHATPGFNYHLHRKEFFNPDPSKKSL